MKEKTKKFLCIKDTIGFKKGEEVATDSVYEKFEGVSYNELTEYFQEQKEEEDEFYIMIDKVLKSCQHTYMLVQELDNVLKAKNII